MEVEVHRMKTTTVKTKAVKVLKAAGFTLAAVDRSGYILDRIDTGAFKLYWSMSVNRHNGIVHKQLGRMKAVLDQAGLQKYIQYMGDHLLLKGEDVAGSN
jgi:hypothetical protein